MKKMFASLWQEEDGFLTFEWVLLVTLLTIGIVAGLSAARDAIIDELGDVAQAMLSLDQSYTIDFPLNIDVHTIDNTSASDSSFKTVMTAEAGCELLGEVVQNVKGDGAIDSHEKHPHIAAKVMTDTPVTFSHQRGEVFESDARLVGSSLEVTSCF